MTTALTLPDDDIALAPPRAARWTLRVAMLGLTLLVLWAAFAQIDQVTRAPAPSASRARSKGSGSATKQR